VKLAFQTLALVSPERVQTTPTTFRGLFAAGLLHRRHAHRPTAATAARQVEIVQIAAAFARVDGREMTAAYLTFHRSHAPLATSTRVKTLMTCTAYGRVLLAETATTVIRLCELMLGPDRARRVRDPLLAQPAVVKLAFQPRALVSLERALKTTTTLRGQSAHLRKLRVKTLHASTKAIHRNSVLTPWATADPKNHAQAPKTAKMRYTHNFSNFITFENDYFLVA